MRLNKYDLELIISYLESDTIKLSNFYLVREVVNYIPELKDKYWNRIVKNTYKDLLEDLKRMRDNESN